MNEFLKDYTIINNLPYGYNFWDQNVRQLRKYRDWFIENKENRLDGLQKAYYAFCGKYLDFTPESLKDLGEFFLHAIETEKLPPEEYAAKRAQFPPEIPIDDFELTVRSLSIIVDVGIYLGEVMIRNNKNLCWEQYISRNKKEYERGHMVIKLNDSLAPYMNPIPITHTIGLKLTHNKFSKEDIFNIYNFHVGRIDNDG